MESQKGKGLTPDLRDVRGDESAFGDAGGGGNGRHRDLSVFLEVGSLFCLIACLSRRSSTQSNLNGLTPLTYFLKARDIR